MATSYLLLPMRRWGAATLYKGAAFLLGERTSWRADLRIFSLDPGVSITVDFQTSATGEESTWKTLVSFGPKTVAGTYTLRTEQIPTPDFTVTPRVDVWGRAYISAINGLAVAELQLSGPFFRLDSQFDLLLLSQELKEWKYGRQKSVEQAEQDIIGKLMYDSETGELDVDLKRVGVHDLIRAEIANQASWIARKSILGQDHSPSALVTARQMAKFYPGAFNSLRNYRPAEAFVWRGR